MFPSSNGKDMDRLIESALRYWENVGKEVKLLDASSASHGTRFGMAVATRYPEYAQAYLKATSIPMVSSHEEMVIRNYIEEVPLEGATDVLPPRQQ